ncbi:MAG: sugar phosphate isomerase/epimerase [Actinobacteria bacterium]|nr:sugar phosphate isomerase/epimerase [Actinomycetota bacterium]
MTARRAHPRVCAHPVSFAPEVRLGEMLEIVSRQGIGWIGAHRQRLLDEGWEEGLDLLERSGVGVAYFVHREWFHLDRPDEWERDSAELCTVIDAAARFGAGLYGTTGPGPAIGLTWERAAEAFLAAVPAAAAYAREKGVSLMLETAQPLFADYHFLHTLRDTLDVVEEAGLRLCLDVHPTWYERDLEALIRRGAPLTDLVQLSDYRPGMRTMDRGIPGEGVMPLERILGWLLEEGYAGVFDLELWGDSGVDDTTAMARGAANVGALLARLGA